MKINIFILFLYFSLISCSSNGNRKISTLKTQNPGNNQETTITKPNPAITDSTKKENIDTARKKCNIHLLAKLEDHLDNPTNEEITDFLETFDASCKSNAEFSEYGNELLFKLLVRFPEKVVSIIEEDDKIAFGYILQELSNPVIEDHHANEIIKKLKNDKRPVPLKIIRSLKKIKE